MKILFIILTVLISYGCTTNNRNIHQTDSNHNLSSHTDIVKRNNYDKIFNESMKQAINEFIQYIKGFKYSTIEEKVLAFYFYSENGKDYFLISAEPYYTKELVKGYTYIDNYIFVFYGEKEIGKKYIDIDKLISYHDTLPGLRSYNDVPLGDYDPFGTLFQIINPDSLILIKKGML